MELLNYLLKVSACSALFFAFYLLVLRKLTFFKINRFYLLASVLLSFAIPAAQITIEREVKSPVTVSENIQEDTINFNEQPLQAAQATAAEPIVNMPFDWLTLLPYLYGAIVAALLLLATWRIFQLLKHTKGTVKEINGLKLVAKQTGFTNCSFFNYVFIDENNLTTEELKVLLQHEQVHVKQYHSVDKLFITVAKALLWFNPVVYLYDKALEQVHEYEADEATSNDFGTEQYAGLLLRLAVSKNSNPLIHNFVKSPIKQRIKMLFNSKSKNMKKLIYLLALPIGLGLIWGFTIKISPRYLNDQQFTLVIDAGHGGNKKGAVVNGVAEKEISLALSNKIKALAEKKGIKVIATRTNDKDVSLQERLKPSGNFLISLHVNSEPKGDSRNGIQMFTATATDELSKTRSLGMTTKLYESLKKVGGIAVAEKPFTQRFFLLENAKMPSVLLEVGFLTNKQDFNFITNEQKQNDLAKAIVDGVLNYEKQQQAGGEVKTGKINNAQENDKPFLERSKRKEAAHIAEKVTIHTAPKPLTLTIWYPAKDVAAQKLWFFINNKLYTESQARNFDADFVKNLPATKGYNTGIHYDIPGVDQKVLNTVIWIGTEPKLSQIATRNKQIYQKYNGTTLHGKVLSYTYSPANKNLIDGFILKSENGEVVKALVEAKFAQQTKAMFKENDQLTIKVYNANYYKDVAYPIISSYMLMKGNKVLFDRWPKTAKLKTKGKMSVSVTYAAAKDKYKDYAYSAQDSTVTDRAKGIIHLYGKARLKNNKEEIVADVIHYNIKTKQRINGTN